MTSAISATTSVFVTAVPKRMVHVRRWLSMLPVVTGNLIGLLGAKLFWVLILSFYNFKIIYFLKFLMNNYYFSVTLCNFISYTML